MNHYPVLKGVGDVQMESQPLREVGPDEVLVRMSCVGICGSDLSLMYKGRLGDYELAPPLGIGHEASGVISKCGANVKHLKPGDRVALEPGEPCRKCDLCVAGKYNVCGETDFHSSPVPNPGSLARYSYHRADMCHKLPEGVSQEEGAVLEPLSVAINACRRAEVCLGSSLLICGSGAIGLFCLVAAKAMGATNIIMTDVREEALKRAKKMGADHTLLVGGGQGQDDPKHLAKEVERVLGCRPEATLECSGVPSSTAMAIYATRSGGVVALVGIGAEYVSLPIFNAAIRELDIRGVFKYVGCYPVGINMIAKGLVDVKPLITHRFAFEEVVKAFETLRSGKDGVIKCVVSCE